MTDRILVSQQIASGVITTTTTLPPGDTVPRVWAVGDWPAVDFAMITPADADLAVIPRGLIIGGAGNLVVRKIGSSTNVTIPVQAGQTLPICPQQIRAATTATSILALY